MATGIKLPPTIRNGALALESDSPQNRKVAMMRMSDGESTHPFMGRPIFRRERGLEAPIFRLSTTAAAAVLRRQITGHFDDMEADDRLKLRGVTVEETEPGRLEATVRFVDLETDTESTLNSVLGGVK